MLPASALAGATAALRPCPRLKYRHLVHQIPANRAPETCHPCQRRERRPI